MTLNDLGRAVRRARRLHGLRQADLAALSGVGTRFVSELENGKPGIELGRALRVIDCVGLDVRIEQKTWERFRVQR